MPTCRMVNSPKVILPTSRVIQLSDLRLLSNCVSSTLYSTHTTWKLTQMYVYRLSVACELACWRWTHWNQPNPWMDRTVAAGRAECGVVLQVRLGRCTWVTCRSTSNTAARCVATWRRTPDDSSDISRTATRPATNVPRTRIANRRSSAAESAASSQPTWCDMIDIQPLYCCLYSLMK